MRPELEAALERAAIMEHEGGMQRAQAEVCAALAHGVKVSEIRAEFARLERMR